MPIAVSLTGEILSMPEITDEQREMLWSVIIRAHVRSHPELLRNLGKQKAGETGEEADTYA